MLSWVFWVGFVGLDLLVWVCCIRSALSALLACSGFLVGVCCLKFPGSGLLGQVLLRQVLLGKALLGLVLLDQI